MSSSYVSGPHTKIKLTIPSPDLTINIPFAPSLPPPPTPPLISDAAISDACCLFCFIVSIYGALSFAIQPSLSRRQEEGGSSNGMQARRKKKRKGKDGNTRGQ